MAKKIMIFLIAFFLSFIPISVVYGADANDLMNMVNIDEIERETEQLLSDYNTGGFSFKECLNGFLSGDMEFSIQKILGAVGQMFFSEITGLLDLVGKIIIISVLGAVLKNLTTSFNNKEIGELGFYVCYLVMVTIVIISFKEVSEYVIRTVDRLAYSMRVMVPVFATLVIASGHITRGTLMSGFIMTVAQLTVTLFKYFIIPGITALGVLTLINNISTQGMLTHLIKFLKSLLTYSMRTIAVLFATVLSLQRLGTAEAGVIAGKTAKAVTGAVPVLGNAMEGAVETALYLFSTLKNGIAATAVIFLLIMALVPVIRVFTAAMIYKVTAALCEPISDSRIIKALSSMGDFTMLLLSAIFTVEFMFIFSVIILLTST